MVNNKIDKTALLFDPIIFIERALYREKRKTIIYSIIFIFLNFVLFLSTLLMGILTPMALAKINVFFGKTIPTWYLYTGLIVSSGSSIISGIINFFIINERRIKSKKNIFLIKGEIFAFENQSQKLKNLKKEKYILYRRIAQILDMNLKEVHDA